MVGYAMLIRGVPDDDDVQRAVTLRPAIELSKMYVLPDSHGAGVSAAMMTAALCGPRDRHATSVWLGVNQQNQRAQRFYGKHGFTINGTKTFRLGEGDRERLRDGAPGLTRRRQREQTATSRADTSCGTPLPASRR